MNTTVRESWLGKIYGAWTESAVFSLLRRIYRAVRSACAGSLILRGILGEGSAENCFRNSFAAGLIRRICALLLSLLSHGKNLYVAAENSAFLHAVRGSRLSFLVGFEGLFGAFLTVMFITPHKYWNNLYTVIAAFVFLLLYFFLVAIGKREWVSPETYGMGWLFFAFALVFSLGFSPIPQDSFRILLFFFASFSLFYVIASDFRDGERLRRLLAFLYVALLVVSLYGVVQHAFHLVKASSSYTDLTLNVGVPGRVYSTLDNPNNLSEFVLMFLPLGAAFSAGAEKTWQRVALASGLVIPALALLYTYSRAGWLAIVLAAVVFTYCCNRRLIPVLFVAGLLLLPFLPASVMTRLSTIGNTADSSTNHRFDIWRGILSLLRDHDRFFTGIGLGPQAFRRVYPFYSVGSAKIGAYHSQMHYLELVLETGILGLLSFLYLMCKSVGRAAGALAKTKGRERLILVAGLSSVAALAFVGLVEYIWFYQRMMFAFFIFMGIFLAATETEPCQECKKRI